jgi:hypothetical protein
MDATKRNIEMENLSTGSQDSLEDPTRLRRVAESDDPEDAVVANSPVSEGFLSFFLSIKHSFPHFYCMKPYQF